jgi:hypothetical protein
LELGNSTLVYQDNNANVRNNVDAKSSTGYNDANRNTGGPVEISTGNATTNVGVSTVANANWAQVGNGGGENGSVDLRIVGNGANSANAIALSLDPSTVLQQSNRAHVYNDVDASAKTGHNDANRNTGGPVSIETGDAKSMVTVENALNFNWADIDCGCLSDIFAKISGNGYDSENNIAAELGASQIVAQDNCGTPMALELSILTNGHHGCSVRNNVDSDAYTGKNDVNENTSSNHADPSVSTGNATSNAEVENTGNANAFGVADFEFPSFEWNWNLSLTNSQLQHLLDLLGL